MGEKGWSPPKWMYRGRRPPNDDACFENMTRVIFLAGLSWKMIDQKWPNFKEAFKGFSIDQVARFTEKDVKGLMSNAGIVRNQAKIVAAVKNAKHFQDIRKKVSSFSPEEMYEFYHFCIDSINLSYHPEKDEHGVDITFAIPILSEETIREPGAFENFSSRDIQSV